MVGALGQPPTLEDEVENALQLLVLNSTEEFGFAPRDVYEGIFSPIDIKNQHANAIWKISRPGNLVALVSEFSVDRSLGDIDGCVAAMHPSENRDGDDDWEIDFESTRIAEKIMEWMEMQEDEHFLEIYGALHRYQVGSALARWVLKAINHP